MRLRVFVLSHGENYHFQFPKSRGRVPKMLETSCIRGATKTHLIDSTTSPQHLFSIEKIVIFILFLTIGTRSIKLLIQERIEIIIY